LDHVAGFDELRAFCWRRDEQLPLYATEECLGTLKQMYGWAFSEDNRYRGYVRPDARVIDGPFVIGDLRITPLPASTRRSWPTQRGTAGSARYHRYKSSCLMCLGPLAWSWQRHRAEPDASTPA
jgi:hypothetical protein